MNYLFLSPHPDDVELACGATIAKLVEEGHNVNIAVFSDCDINKDEMYQAHEILNAKTFFYNFPRRNFDKYRQPILDAMIWLRDHLNPDVVFIPDESDIHQDHQVVGSEGLRAFRMRSDVVGYAHVHNQIERLNNYYIHLSESNIGVKLDALKCYTSQKFRYYFTTDSIMAVIRCNGTQCGVEFAEAFRIIKQLK